VSQRREAAYQAVLLAGSVILLGLSISQLPPRLALLKAPSTPFDRSDAKAIAPAYRLLSQAALRLPVGASVAVRSEPRNLLTESTLFYGAVALLPDHIVFPAAIWSMPMPEEEGRAEYLVVVGPTPSLLPGRLLLKTPDGSLWRRDTQ